MRKDVTALQQFQELTQRKNNRDKYYYWESCRLSRLFYKTAVFRIKIDNTLDLTEKAIFYMRYVFKFPIMKIVQQTGYCKRMIQYKLNSIIKKLD